MLYVYGDVHTVSSSNSRVDYAGLECQVGYSKAKVLAASLCGSCSTGVENVS